MKVFAGFVAALFLAASAGWAQYLQAPTDLFRVEWEARQTPDGRTLISGYVRNGAGYLIANVRLLVEGLDPSGQVVTKTTGYLHRQVPPFQHGYFEVRVPAGAAAYRVTLISYDLAPLTGT